jgi:hypothetical protein
MKSHTGAMMSMGKGCVYAVSRRQRLNTTSSTEAELVGVSNTMGLILWTRRFLEAQGYKVRDNIVHQDNQSAMLLENNGRMSSSKRTQHIDIQYFFVTDHIKQGDLRVAYCPTNDMITDFFTKPLQGTKYQQFRSLIMNSSDAVVALEECVENVSAGPCPAISDSDAGIPTLPTSSNPSQATASWIEVKRQHKPHSKPVREEQSERKAHSVYPT